MNVLLIGGAGFIGARTALRLLEAGHDVTVLDSLDPQIHGPIPAQSPTLSTLWGHTRFIAGDARDPRLLKTALDNADAVALFAAGTGTGQSMYQIRHYSEVNILPAAQIAEHIVSQPGRIRRVLLSSTRALYGEGAGICPSHGRVFPPARLASKLDQGRFDTLCPHCSTPVTPAASLESDPVAPSSVYGITKLTQEQLLLTACQSAQTPAIALRYQNVYGPGQSTRNPYTGILSIFSQLLLQNSPINIFEDGAPTRDFVFIDDVVEYNVRALTQEISGAHIFNVGTGARQSLLDVVQTLSKALGKSPQFRVSGQYRLGDIRHAAADGSRLARHLGSIPWIPFSEGVARFVDWVAQLTPASDSTHQYQRSLSEMAALGLLRGRSTAPGATPSP